MLKFSIAFTVFISFNVFGQCPILPTPTSYKSQGKKVYFDSIIPLQFNGISSNVVTFFTSMLNSVTGLKVVYSHEDGIVLNGKKIPQASLANGGYSIDLAQDSIHIGFDHDAGQINAIVSLLQLFQKDSKGWFVEECMIKDQPQFQWRGLHLDVSRHFFTVSEVKRYIDLMAMYKFNMFHWHLTDDQGWRIEIKQYPKLTSIGGYRDSTIIGHYSDQPWKWDRNRYGGYYTQEQIKEVIRYAADRYIEVIPEIEMPGHSRAALAAYPEYSCTGVEQSVVGTWGVFEDIYCSKQETLDFLKDILTEVIELFPSKFIHIGGDEAPKARWKECDKCLKVMQENNLKDVNELQSYFIGEMDAFLTEKGRKLIGWDEILEGGLSPNAAVMSWRGEDGGIKAANARHEVVMSPTTYCYFDYYQSAHPIEPIAIGGYLPLEKVYQFNPIPKGLQEGKSRYILGGQANLWTEYIHTFDHVEYMMYPRAIALSQSLWSSTKPSYEKFLQNYLDYHEDYLKRLNVNFARSIHYPNLSVTRGNNGINIQFTGASEDAHFDVLTKVSGDWAATSGDVVGNSDTLYIERSPVGKMKEVNFNVTSDKFKEVISYSFDAHSSLGLPVEMITAPHPKYDHNGGLNLVDGIHGRLPWKGSEWLGFTNDTIEFIMDLQSVSSLQSLELGFLDSNGSWIYLPEAVKVYGSANGKKWKFLGCNDRVEVKCNVRTKSKEVKYIKVVIYSMKEIPEGNNGAGHHPWTFIDEVVVNYKEQ